MAVQLLQSYFELYLSNRVDDKGVGDWNDYIYRSSCIGTGAKRKKIRRNMQFDKTLRAKVKGLGEMSM